MLKFIFNRKQRRLNLELDIAIMHAKVTEVEKWLRAGADPNAYGLPGISRNRPLANAIKYHAPLAIIDALLKAGANPQEPYHFMGREFRLSEAAELNEFSSEVIQRLKAAEKEAEAKNGPREVFRGYNICKFNPKFGT